jgi:hypothetical protein
VTLRAQPGECGGAGARWVAGREALHPRRAPAPAGR